MKKLAAALLSACIAAPALADGLVVEDASGTAAPLATHTGTAPAAVHFWATWCGPCLTELPRLADLMADRPDLAAHIVIVSVDTRSIDSVRAFLADRLGLDLETLRVVEGTPGDTYGVRAYPATVFLAGDGTLAAKVEGSIDWSDPDRVADLAASLAD
ncbi:TlpA family protein disulfide reductase [Acuticoccus sediminis]|uniref:TlpA family protein disulfide reductase n=1 Tax=Acuticoccus sediminis TaxID=2184697 RepID=UPI001CFC81FB|nr:TlpA disulfide reductase family protein [Acuticoccus sediminis]